MDFLEEFIQIINALRNAIIKNKGQNSNVIEIIYWDRDLRENFPEKGHIFDWFPNYFQRSNRDKI